MKAGMGALGRGLMKRQGENYFLPMYGSFIDAIDRVWYCLFRLSISNRQYGLQFKVILIIQI